jgi:hypothetical protein
MIKAIAVFLVIGVLVQLGMLFYIHEEFRSGRQDLVNSQRDGCERNKHDSFDNAAFQRAHSHYIQKVTSAKSVEEDVKNAAREARRVFVSTARRLSIRAQINCKEAFK